jgi:hypothetical protein
MAAVFDYVCRTCGARTEFDRLPKEGAEMRHLVPIEGYKGVSRVCGTFQRSWASVNFNKVPGGGRG